MSRFTKIYMSSTSSTVLDFLIQTETVASTPTGSTVYFDIEELLNHDLDLPADLQDLIAEAQSNECEVMELYR